METVNGYKVVKVSNEEYRAKFSGLLTDEELSTAVFALVNWVNMARVSRKDDDRPAIYALSVVNKLLGIASDELKDEVIRSLSDIGVELVNSEKISDSMH